MFTWSQKRIKYFFLKKSFNEPSILIIRLCYFKITVSGLYAFRFHCILWLAYLNILKDCPTMLYMLNSNPLGAFWCCSPKCRVAGRHHNFQVFFYFKLWKIKENYSINNYSLFHLLILFCLILYSFFILCYINGDSCISGYIDNGLVFYLFYFFKKITMLFFFSFLHTNPSSFSLLFIDSVTHI